MFIGLFLGLMSAPVAIDDGGHRHHATIEHRGAPISVAYNSTTTIDMRQVGMSPPTRMGVIRCNWVARVSVERRLSRTDSPSPALSRTVSDGFEIKGSRNGYCTGARKAIEQDIARRDDDIRAHVLAIAERDRAILLAELDAAIPSAG